MKDIIFVKKGNKITSSFILFIYFIFLFIHTLQIEGNKTLLFGYILSILTSFLYLLHKSKINKNSMYTCLFIFSSFFLYLTPDIGYVLNQFKYWIYLFPLLVIPFITSTYKFNLILSESCFVTLILSLFLFCIGIGIDNGYGFPRMHGLLSEPSALSFPISIVLLNGVLYKKKVFAIISLVCLLLTGSLMAILITTFTFLMFIFITRKVIKRIFITVGIVCFIWFSIFLIEYLAQLGGYSSVTRLHQGILFIESMGTNGYNPRFFSVLEVFNYIKDNSFLFGLGINGAESYVNYTGNLRDLNLWMEILLAFGVIGTGLFFLLICIFIFFSKNIFDKDEAILLSTITVYCFLNSAQGIVFQSLFFIILMQVFKRTPIYDKKNYKFI